MLRHTRAVLPLAALFGLTAAGPVLAQAQDAQATIARAQNTLNQMEKVLDEIAARNGGATSSSSPTAMQENTGTRQRNPNRRGNRNGNRRGNRNRHNQPQQPNQPK